MQRTITLKEYNALQIQEILKHIWCKGCELHCNPLALKTFDAWAIEWIIRHGPGYRFYITKILNIKILEESNGRSN